MKEANFSLQKKFEDALNDCETHLKQMDDLEMKVKFLEEKDKSKENYLKKKDDLIKALEEEKREVKNEFLATEKKVK